MARRPGERFPSDHRRWFRVAEDILDDPKLARVSADVFRFYLRLLAMLNRTKSRDGTIRLDRFALNACAMREQRRHALAIARSGADTGLYGICEDGQSVTISVPNWLKFQQLAPETPHQAPSVTPRPTPTPTPTPTQAERPAPGRSKDRQRARATRCPDRLEESDRSALLAWAGAHGFSGPQVAWAVERVRDWARAKDEQRVDWVATIRNAMSRGWALEGYKAPPSSQAGPTPVQLRNRLRVQKAREELERERAVKAGRSRPTQDDPVAIGRAIDEGLARGSR